MAAEQPPSLIPLVIGITGKRDLRGRDAAVRSALAAVLDRLDAAYPHSPRIMLSALAEGADRLAAEEAAGRPGWQVVAPLPLPRAAYAEDFDAAGQAWFDAFLARPGVASFALPALAEDTSRAAHYEQVGQYIADCCTLLIAVMAADETPGRLGGTARIVAYKLRGHFDEDAATVAARSSVVDEPCPLDVVPAGTVWVVDLGAPQAPVQVRSNMAGRESGTDRSLPLAGQIEEFNRRTIAAERALGRTPAAPRFGAQDARTILECQQRGLSELQGAANRRLRRSVWALALLSAVAVLCFELFSARGGIPLLHWFVVLYVAFGTAALAVYWVARLNNWQPIAEEYRAVAEVLRVQQAWWDAGLATARADRFYLEGVRGPLTLVREAVRAAISAARILSTSPGSGGGHGVWIASQVDYYTDRIARRRARLVALETSGWSAFAGSLGAVAVVALHQFPAPRPLGGLADWYDRHLPPGIPLGLGVAAFVLLGLFFVLTRKRHVEGHGDTHWQVVAGLVTGVVIALGAFDASRGDPTLAEDLAATFAIALAATVGAARYAAEKLSWEAELRGYEEALEFFKRARDTILDPRTGLARRDEILLELGKKALAENERWLRTHRERPLEPVVGG
ncbi:MAG: hypothetical protein WDM91_19030 [Rhizomicrobium sp.]